MQGAATLLFGLMADPRALVASCLLQGLSASVVYVGGFALLIYTVPREEIGAWMGFVMTFGNLGLLISPFLGDILYRKLGYHAVFVAMLALVVIDVGIILGMRMEKGDERQDGRLEGLESADGQARENEPLMRNHGAPAPGEGSPSDRKCGKTPVFLDLLSRPRIFGAIYGVTVAQTLNTSLDGVLGMFARRTFGWNSSIVGLLFLTVCMPTLAASLAGMLSDRCSPCWVAASGYSLAAAVFAGLSFVDRGGSSQIALLYILLVALGLHSHPRYVLELEDYPALTPANTLIRVRLFTHYNSTRRRFGHRS